MTGTGDPSVGRTGRMIPHAEALRRLAEAEDRLRAIETGEIERPNHAQITDDLRFLTVVEALQEGVVVQDAEGRVLEANRMASQIVGIALTDLVTDPPSKLSWQAVCLDGTPMGRDQSPGRRALDLGRPVLGVVLGIDRAGQRLWLEINAVPVRFPGESDLPVVVSSFRDVTARVAADESIRFQALLLNTAGQAIIALGLDMKVLYWNQRAEQMYGWSAADALGRPVTDLIASNEGADLRRTVVAALRNGESWSSDYSISRPDGSTFPVFATSTPVLNDDGAVMAIITVATDITERKEAEAHARRLSSIVESSTDAIIGLKLDGVITSWNAGAQRLYGYEAAEVVGEHVSVIVPAEKSDELAELLRRAALGETTHDLETLRATRDGRLLHISLSWSPIVDADGRPIGASSIGRDITDRLKLERLAEKAAADLLRAQHEAEIESMGRDEAIRANRAKNEFLSRMSHELRTPLNAVLGFGQLLAMDDLTADQRESVDLIRRAGQHLLDLINDVLDISRIEAGGLKLSIESLDLPEIVTNALRLIQPQAATHDITMPVETDCAQVRVLADRQGLLQVLLNLLSNAVKYNRPGGRVDLQCRVDADTVSIAVRDTGVGMGPDDLARLFTPFERLGAETTDVQGTGVGLALARSLSEQMGGSLSVSSVVGTGTTFTLTLPAERPGQARLAPRPSAADQVAGSAPRPFTLLAIEDNVANVRLLERALEHRDDVQLLTAIQGRLGLELAAQHRPDLILLDMHLPDVNGIEVLRRVRAEPDIAGIPVVVCSADDAYGNGEQLFDVGADAFLPKPIQLSQLFELIDGIRAGDRTHETDAPG